MTNYHLSIRSQLFVLMLAIVLPLSGLIGYYIYDESRQATKVAYAKLDMISEHTASDASRIISEHETLLARFAQMPSIIAMDGNSCKPIIENYALLRDQFTAITIRDLEGNPICSTSPNPPQADRMMAYPWFQRAIHSNEFILHNALIGSSSLRWVAPQTQPIFNAKGEVNGLLVLGADLLKLSAHLFELTHGNAVELVVDQTNTIVLHSVNPTSYIGTPLSEKQVADSLGSESGFFSSAGPDGQRTLFSVNHIGGTGWRVFAEIPEDELFADYYQRRNDVLLAVSVLLLMVLLISWRFSLNISRPISEFAQAAKSIAGGESAERVHIDGPAEIEYLAYHFNRTLDALEKNREERAALVGHVEKLFRKARDVILLIGPSGNIVEVNDAAVATYGYDKEELLGMTIGNLQAAELPGRMRTANQPVVEKEGRLFETMHQRKDGSTFPVEISSSVIDIEGKSYQQSFIRDITERHEAALQIARLNRAYATLSQTNEAIVRMRDAPELFSRICNIAVESGGYVGAWVGLREEGNARLTPVARAGDIDDYLTHLANQVDPSVVEGGPAGQALKSGLPYFCQSVAEDSSTKPWRAAAAEHGIHSMVALPLKRSGSIIGALIMYSAETHVFDLSMRRLLEEMAVDVSFALDNFEREAARSHAEKEVVQSEARYRGIIETAHDAFILIGPHGEILDANNGASQLSGYSREELLKMTLRDLEAIETDQELANTITGVMTAGYGRFEKTWRNKSGLLVGVEISTTYMGKERGGYFFAFVHNIDERKRVEQVLRQEEARFRSMLEQNISAMFVIENGAITYANRRAGEILGYRSEELLGMQLLDLIAEPSNREIVIREFKALLAGARKSIDGNFKALRKDGTIADIGANAVLATLQGKSVVLGMAQDIGERQKAQIEIEHYITRLESAMESTLSAVSLMVELRDPYTAGHERRVGELAAAIGTEMGLEQNLVKGLRLAGYVHDIGKISVPAEILSKPSKLTPMEFELIKGHCQSGYDVLHAVDFPWPVAQIILQHHERLDGSGYPRQLRDDEIILEARIMAVADVVEAMSSHRPYRPGLGVEAALEEITKNKGIYYDSVVVDACLKLYREKAYVQSE